MTNTKPNVSSYSTTDQSKADTAARVEVSNIETLALERSCRVHQRPNQRVLLNNPFSPSQQNIKRNLFFNYNKTKTESCAEKAAKL